MESPIARSSSLSPLKMMSLLAVVAAMTSCRAVSFYRQAARGQWQISQTAVPITKVLRDVSTSAELRAKLELVQELRRFAARELMLPADSQYDHYCDLKRKFVVWVVYAAPEFSVEARTWWYPVVGKLKYRGFFREQEAKREAARLRAGGDDVFVSGTEAYSTLGWLRDPVLNTFLHRSDAHLAELIFHELTHQRLYLAGDTDFNEALATAVGEEGARRWLRSKGRTAELNAYNAENRLQREIVSAILHTRDRLKVLYDEQRRAPADRLRTVKSAELSRLRVEVDHIRQQSPSSSAVKSPPASLLNNASLNSVAAYYTLLPGFERMLAAGRGDLATFFHRIEAMKHMGKQQRRMALTGVPPDPS